MGRWAQRSRAGGGVTPLNAMQSGRRVDNFNWRITYAAAIDAAELAAGQFISDPSGVTVSSITQIGPREVAIQWDDTTTAETGIEYTGDTPGVLTPQTLIVP